MNKIWLRRKRNWLRRKRKRRKDGRREERSSGMVTLKK